MSTDAAKIRSKLTKLDESLDQLEFQLEPLFSQSLPETLLALDTVQQAKLQVIIPYVVYDLIFVYLKSRGIDPKTHRVVTELERVRQYFDKIKRAEESSQKRKLEIDRAAAGRFIKHAIAQAKNAQLVDEGELSDPETTANSTHERIPARVTSKMAARAEYERELEQLESEEDLKVFDEGMAVDDGETMDMTEDPSQETRFRGLDKGKGRALETEQSKSVEVPSSMRKRHRTDPFAGYENLSVSESMSQIADDSKKAKPVRSSSEDRKARRVVKKAKRKVRET